MKKAKKGKFGDFFFFGLKKDLEKGAQGKNLYTYLIWMTCAAYY